MPPKLHVPLAECGPHLGLVRGSLRPPDSKTANRLAHSFCGAHDCDQQTHAETTLHLRQQTARVSHAMRPKNRTVCVQWNIDAVSWFRVGSGDWVFDTFDLRRSIRQGAVCSVNRRADWWHLRSCDDASYDTIRYDTIRDAILTCDRKPTWVRLIYRTETTTEKWKTEKLKSKNGYA